MSANYCCCLDPRDDPMVAGQSKLTMDDLGTIQKIAKSKTRYNACASRHRKYHKKNENYFESVSFHEHMDVGDIEELKYKFRFHEKTFGLNESSKLIIRNNLRLPDNNNTRLSSDRIFVWQPLFSCARLR